MSAGQILSCVITNVPAPTPTPSPTPTPTLVPPPPPPATLPPTPPWGTTPWQGLWLSVKIVRKIAWYMLQIWNFILSCASSKSLDIIITAKARVKLNLVMVIILSAPLYDHLVVLQEVSLWTLDLFYLSYNTFNKAVVFIVTNYSNI